jgi:molecular chaperone GrpE (heat shock protein)
MPDDERVSAEGTPTEAAALARRQARDLLRALSEERRRADTRLHQSRSDLKAIVLAAVDGIEALAGMVEALGDGLPAESSRVLSTAAQAAWERLEVAGVVRDGAAGEALDVSRHKVVKRQPSGSAPPNTVVQVLSPGIVFGNERLRDAAVVVSK